MIYHQPGIYPVELVLSNGKDSCKCVSEQAIEVEFRAGVCNFYVEGKVLSGDPEKKVLIGTGDSIRLDPENLYRNTVSIEWIMEGQDEFFSDVYRPKITYEEAGVYDVAMTLSRRGKSCRVWKKDFIQVIQALRARFRFHVETQANNIALVYFVDISRGNPTSWDWEVEFRFEDVVKKSLGTRFGSYRSAYPIQELLIPSTAVYLHISAHLKIQRGSQKDEFRFERKVDLF